MSYAPVVSRLLSQISHCILSAKPNSFREPDAALRPKVGGELTDRV
jgi:hypothetical protein